MNVPRANAHRARPALLLGAVLLAWSSAGAEPAALGLPAHSVRTAGDTTSPGNLVQGIAGWPLYRNDGFAIRFPPGWDVSSECGHCMARHQDAGSALRAVLRVGLVGPTVASDWLQASEVLSLIATIRNRRNEPVLLGTQRFHILDLTEEPDRTRLLCTADSTGDGARGVIRVELLHSRRTSAVAAAEAEVSELALLDTIASTFELGPRIPRFPATDGRDGLRVGQALLIEWSPASPDSAALVEITLQDIRYESGHPQGSALIAKVPNTGRYLWTVPESLGTLLPVGRDWPYYDLCLQLATDREVPCSDCRGLRISGTSQDVRLPQAPWKTYRNDKIGFTIRCPEYLICSEDESPADTLVTIGLPREIELECLRDTYTHFYITIAATRDPQAMPECLQTRVSGNSVPGKRDEMSGIRFVVPGEVKLGGTEYVVDDAPEGAAGHWYYNRSYKTIQRRACIEIKLVIWGTSYGPYLRSNTLYRLISKEPLLQDLEQVIATIEFDE